MATKYGKEAQKKMNAAMGKEQVVQHRQRARCAYMEQIAEGGYAFVYKAEDVETGQILALKRMLIQDEENIGLADTEIDIMVRTAALCPALSALRSSHPGLSSISPSLTALLPVLPCG